VTVRSWVWACGCSLAGIVGSNLAGGIDVCCECCVLSDRGLWDELITRPQTSYRVCGVSECEHKFWIMGKPWPSEGSCVLVIKSNTGEINWKLTRSYLVTARKLSSIKFLNVYVLTHPSVYWRHSRGMQTFKFTEISHVAEPHKMAYKSFKGIYIQGAIQKF
jgi:hypothetical protein